MKLINFYSKFAFLNIAFSIFALPAWSNDYFSDNFIRQNLQRFEKKPKTFMNSAILKKYRAKKHQQKQVTFHNHLKKNLSEKDRNIIKKIHVAPSNNDQIEQFIPGMSIVKNIDIIHEKKLFTGEVSTIPWSDDYWPIFKGILGARYADEEYEYFTDWDQAHNYVMATTAKHIFESQNTEAIDKLSPAEKYDLLLGPNSMPLTQMGWAEGKHYFDTNGAVETWMGICHGWAAASYMLPRPQNKVTVMAHDGKTPITFYPSDIKALASLLWAKTQTPTRFVGGRCNIQNPKQDENGRIIDQNCIDSNPATWHLAMVNQIGLKKKSMVMDATFDYEVWNQPIISYEFKYFNPVSKEPTMDIQKAIVAINEYHNDKFKQYRDPRTKFVIGITMEVRYAVETDPVQRGHDTPEYDAHNFAYYDYDLEIDKNRNIIGGEWYRNNHPDFLWTPEQNSRAMTYGDYYLMSSPNWKGTSSLPYQWRQIAQAIAQRSGAPLAKIVESLIEMSNNQK